MLQLNGRHTRQIRSTGKPERISSREHRACNWLNSKRGECGQGQNRTADTRIFSPLLYRLSYLATALKYCLKGTGSQDSRLRFPILFCPVLDEVYYLTFQANAVQRINLLDTCGAGNIDFGKITADHIQAGKVKAILLKQR